MANNDKEKKQDKKEEKKDKPKTDNKVKDDLKAKANNLLLKHPEILNNARHLFRNENGTTIIQEVVPRGDAKPSDIQVQGDLQDMDLRGLAVYAKALLNDNLLKYDKKVAFEDALWSAIKTKDNGKYQGKVNASTFDLILSYLDGMKTAKDLGKKPQQDEKKDVPVEVKPAEEKLGKKPEDKSEETEPKKVVQVTEVTRKIMTPGQEQALKGETPKGEKPEHVSETDKRKYQQFQEQKENQDQDDKSKSDKEANNGRNDMEKELVLKTIEVMENQISELKKSLEVKPEEKKDEKDEKPVEASTGVKQILDSLDKIAGQLEETQQLELLKVAYSIDAIADVIEGKRTAATLESDLDEEYMKKYFKGGLREGDADEKAYMGEFNSDLTTQVEQAQEQLVKGKSGIKLASDRPYVILKD